MPARKVKGGGYRWGRRGKVYRGRGPGPGRSNRAAPSRPGAAVGSRPPMAWDKTERRLVHRRQYDAAREYGREELCLLLESHRDTIASNTILLERLQKLLAGQDQALVELAALHRTIDTLAEQLQAHTEETFKEHHGHRLRMYGAYVGMVTIILGLIGLLAKVWPTGVPLP